MSQILNGDSLFLLTKSGKPQTAFLKARNCTYASKE